MNGNVDLDRPTEGMYVPSPTPGEQVPLAIELVCIVAAEERS